MVVFKDYYLGILSYLILVICVLISVAFLTLLERRVLGYIQIRRGPNQVSICGLPQPFADAIKLFSKEQTFPLLSNYYPYYISPIFSLFLSLVIWLSIPYLRILTSFSLSWLFFLSCTRMGVYTVISAGWSSNSNYALLGGLRAVAQTISYEVSLALILLSFILLSERYDLLLISKYQYDVWFLFIMFPLSLAWLASCLAETNRTPFDFAEGESELVSGFNIEYRAGGFALIFIAEYARILFMRLLYALIFLGGNIFSLFFYFKFIFLSFVYVWVRGTLPRFRYDKLIYIANKRPQTPAACECFANRLGK